MIWISVGVIIMVRNIAYAYLMSIEFSKLQFVRINISGKTLLAIICNLVVAPLDSFNVVMRQRLPDYSLIGVENARNTALDHPRLMGKRQACIQHTRSKQRTMAGRNIRVGLNKRDCRHCWLCYSFKFNRRSTGKSLNLKLPKIKSKICMIVLRITKLNYLLRSLRGE